MLIAESDVSGHDPPVSTVQHEAAGWAIGKVGQDIIYSVMNGYPSPTYTLEDVILTWVVENDKNARLRGEQDVHILNIEDPISVSVPAQVVLASPSNNVENQDTALTLTWNPVFGTDHYRLQLARDTTFTDIVLDDSLLQTNTKNVAQLSSVVRQK